MRFLLACKLSQAEINDFDETKLTHHENVRGRHVCVKVGINDRGFPEVRDFRPLAASEHDAA